MTIEEMKKRKIELGYSNKDLAQRSGVPLGTLQKIFAGQTKAPRLETVQAIEKALQKEPDPASRSGRSFAYDISESSRPQNQVCEPAMSYTVKKKDGYTLEDYLALPEDQRVELIDGVFYDMASPTTVHQALGGFIYKFLLDFVLEKGGPCMPFMSPVDVQLDRDDRTVVQPDVLIVCDREKYQNGRVFGAPDFLVEVLSPSTRKKDMQLKLFKYGNAGVREYWIVDPKQKRVITYDLEKVTIPVIYTFSDQIPVAIWENRCIIDFAKIDRAIDFLYF